MAADLDKPKIITPTGCPNGALIVGTGSSIEAHTLVSGTDEIDAVTVELISLAGTLTGTLTWPNTSGTATTISRSAAITDGAVLMIDRWTGNGGGKVFITGPANTAYKVSVERYPAGK